MGNGGPYPRFVTLDPASQVAVSGGTVGLTGTLPSFAVTPTFNLGTLNGAATAAEQVAILAALGSPFQAGGSIGNTAFGITGAIPAGTNLIGFTSPAAAATGGYSFTNIHTATTTTAKSGAGTLHAIAVNTYVASATVTIYDNTTATGTKIGTITMPSVITGMPPGTLIYDLAFATGLTIVTSDAVDLTVMWK